MFADNLLNYFYEGLLWRLLFVNQLNFFVDNLLKLFFVICCLLC